jgi:regulator of protease activity HflC (stomatin/prohibitin superfamily)
MSLFSINVLAILAVIAAFVAWHSFVIVPQGYHYTVLSWGRYTRTFDQARIC